MRTGVLILNYNDAEHTIKLVNTIKRFSAIDQILVLDNCSTDDSMQVLTQELEGISGLILQKSDRNGGYAYGNNYGMNILKEKNCDYVIIANPDVVFDENYVLACQNLMSDYSMASAIMQLPSGKCSSGADYFINTYQDDFWDCFFLGKKRGTAGSNIDISGKPVLDVEMLPGSLFMVRVDDYMQVGGMDESTFLYCEERILGKKLSGAGKKIALITNMKYLHEHSVSVNKNYNVHQKIKILYDSRLYYHQKYNGIRGVRYNMLKTATKISLAEYRLRDFIKSHK